MKPDFIIPTQTCWSCEHFLFEVGSPHYSSWTPGWSATMECTKGQWRNPCHRDGDTLAHAMEIGFTCPLFEKRPDVAETD